MQEVFLPSRYDMQPGEAVQAEASTSALQGWLNRGPFRMTHRLDEPTDRYGRALRTVYRLRPGRQRVPAGGLHAPRRRRAGLFGWGQRGVVLILVGFERRQLMMKKPSHQFLTSPIQTRKK